VAGQCRPRPLDRVKQSAARPLSRRAPASTRCRSTRRSSGRPPAVDELKASTANGGTLPSPDA